MAAKEISVKRYVGGNRQRDPLRAELERLARLRLRTCRMKCLAGRFC